MEWLGPGWVATKHGQLSLATAVPTHTAARWTSGVSELSELLQNSHCECRKGTDHEVKLLTLEGLLINGELHQQVLISYSIPNQSVVGLQQSCSGVSFLFLMLRLVGSDGHCSRTVPYGRKQCCPMRFSLLLSSGKVEQRGILSGIHPARGVPSKGRKQLPDQSLSCESSAWASPAERIPAVSQCNTHPGKRVPIMKLRFGLSWWEHPLVSPGCSGTSQLIFRESIKIKLFTSFQPGAALSLRGFLRHAPQNPSLALVNFLTPEQANRTRCSDPFR